jgi:hypothetical protein
MDRSDGVQFVDDDGSLATPEDDVVALGNGAIPRWLTVLVVAIALAGVIGFALSRGDGHPSAATGAVPTVSSAPLEPQLQGVGAPLPLGPTAAIDVAVFGGRIYALQVGRIAAVDQLTRQIVGQASVPGANDGASLQLIPDPANQLLWIASTGTLAGFIAEYDARTLHLLRAAPWHATLRSATVLDGSLYFTSDSGLAVWPLDAATPRVVAGMADHRGTVAADPTRDRLLLVDNGRNLSSYRPGGAVSVPVAAPVMKGDLVVVQGTIWFVGFAVTGTAVFAAVNPVTLRLGNNAGVVVDLGLGAETAGVGASVVWLRNASGSGGLWCVDARSGRVFQSWGSAPGNVASVSHAGYLAPGFALLPLIMNSCPG